ncbi:MAG: hypothetical protein ACFFDW_10020 [Candidatus Thorarchaeota archaeon]
MSELNKRLISIDIFKGLAIIGVLLLHPTLYDNFHYPALAQSIIPTYLFIVLLPLSLLGTFAGGFPFLSSIVGTYNICNRLNTKKSLKDASIPILLNSTILILFDPIKTILVDRTYWGAFNTDEVVYSVLGRLLETGELVFPSVEKFFQIGILPAIGFGGYLTVFLLWLLFRKNGKEKIKRNIIILTVIGLLLAAAYHPLSTAIDPFISDLFFKGGGFIFIAFILRLFFGHQLSFFPMIVYAVFGIICGYLLAQKKEQKWITQYGLIMGSIFLLGFGISFLISVLQAGTSVMSVVYDILDYYLYPKELLFISMAIIMFAFILIVKTIEYRSEEKRERIAKRTTFLKNFGMVTLTLYFLDPIINQSLGTLFHYIFNGGILFPFDVADPYMSNALAIGIFEITFITFWVMLVFFWSKIKFRFGLEHLIILATNPLRKIKSQKLPLSESLMKIEENTNDISVVNQNTEN